MEGGGWGAVGGWWGAVGGRGLRTWACAATRAASSSSCLICATRHHSMAQYNFRKTNVHSCIRLAPWSHTLNSRSRSRFCSRIFLIFSSIDHKARRVQIRDESTDPRKKIAYTKQGEQGQYPNTIQSCESKYVQNGFLYPILALWLRHAREGQGLLGNMAMTFNVLNFVGAK